MELIVNTGVRCGSGATTCGDLCPRIVDGIVRPKVQDVSALLRQHDRTLIPFVVSERGGKARILFLGARAERVRWGAIGDLGPGGRSFLARIVKIPNGVSGWAHGY